MNCLLKEPTTFHYQPFLNVCMHLEYNKQLSDIKMLTAVSQCLVNAIFLLAAKHL